MMLVAGQVIIEKEFKTAEAAQKWMDAVSRHYAGAPGVSTEQHLWVTVSSTGKRIDQIDTAKGARA